MMIQSLVIWMGWFVHLWCFRLQQAALDFSLLSVQYNQGIKRTVGVAIDNDTLYAIGGATSTSVAIPSVNSITLDNLLNGVNNWDVYTWQNDTTTGTTHSYSWFSVSGATFNRNNNQIYFTISRSDELLVYNTINKTQISFNSYNFSQIYNNSDENCIVNNNTHIFIIGGRLYKSETEIRIKTLQIYDIENDLWYYGSDMHKNRSYFACEYDETNNYVWAVGGRTLTDTGTSRRYSNTVEYYDISTDTWKLLNTRLYKKRGTNFSVLWTMPNDNIMNKLTNNWNEYPRYNEQWLYVFGGNDNTSGLTQTEIISIVSDDTTSEVLDYATYGAPNDLPIVLRWVHSRWLPSYYDIINVTSRQLNDTHFEENILIEKQFITVAGVTSPATVIDDIYLGTLVYNETVILALQTGEPSMMPSMDPTSNPTDDPTNNPTKIPTNMPTDVPSASPTSIEPSRVPSIMPSDESTSLSPWPSGVGTVKPTGPPSESDVDYGTSTTRATTKTTRVANISNDTANNSNINNNNNNNNDDDNNNNNNSNSSDFYLTLLIIITSIIVGLVMIGLIVFIQINRRKKMKILATMAINKNINDTPGNNMIEPDNDKSVSSSKDDFDKNNENQENNDSAMHKMNDRDSIVVNEGASNISSHASMTNNFNNRDTTTGVSTHNNNSKMESVVTVPHTTTTNESNKFRHGERDTICDDDVNGIEMLNIINIDIDIDNIEGSGNEMNENSKSNSNSNSKSDSKSDNESNDSGTNVEDMYIDENGFIKDENDSNHAANNNNKFKTMTDKNTTKWKKSKDKTSRMKNTTKGMKHVTLDSIDVSIEQEIN